MTPVSGGTTVTWDTSGTCAAEDFTVIVGEVNGQVLETMNAVTGTSKLVTNLPTCVLLYAEVKGRNTHGPGLSQRSDEFSVPGSKLTRIKLQLRRRKIMAGFQTL